MSNFNQLILFSFADESIQFQCRYGRTVTVESQMTAPGAPPQPVLGVGELSYDINVDVGDHGGNTLFNITANHNFNGITPK